MTVRDLLVSGTEELSRAGVPSPRVDAEWLLAHALDLPRTELYADGDEAPADRERLFRELVARRAAREPLAYVLGEWGFRRLVLKHFLKATTPVNQVSGSVANTIGYLSTAAWYFRKPELDFLMKSTKFLLGDSLEPHFNFFYRRHLPPCELCQREVFRCACEQFERVGGEEKRAAA